ncbi:MAG: hypothetical protein JSU01_19920 [Bacteroidetes bacterium]|nr:hypothetical protein [Bacteroidota bacterium]
MTINKPGKISNARSVMVLVLAVVYLLVSGTHLFLAKKHSSKSAHHYNSIFKRKHGSRAAIVQRVDKTVRERNKKVINRGSQSPPKVAAFATYYATVKSPVIKSPPYIYLHWIDHHQSFLKNRVFRI